MRGLFAAAAALIVTSTAIAGDIVIRPGVGIGKLRLGMAEKDARRAYAGAYVERESLTFNRERVRISYGLSGFSAVLEGRRGSARVVEVETFAAGERTASGIGVGSTERRLMQAYGRRLACSKLIPNRDGFIPEVRSCTLRDDEVETIFLTRIIATRVGIAQFLTEWNADKARIYRVILRSCVRPVPPSQVCSS